MKNLMEPTPMPPPDPLPDVTAAWDDFQAAKAAYEAQARADAFTRYLIDLMQPVIL